MAYASIKMTAGGAVKLSTLASERRTALRAATLALLMLAVACGGTKSTETGGTTNGDITFGKDNGLGDSLADGDLGDSSSTDDAPFDGVGDEGDATDAVDALPGDGATATDGDAGDASKTCEFAANPKPGAPGAACKANTDCQSDLCVDGPQGKLCTVTCTDCCPTGFTCSAYGTGSGDQTFACLPKINALCQPCKADSECGAFGAGALCVTYGESGSFCGAACAIGADCPGGYACQEVNGTDAKAKQCFKTEQDCACSPAGISAGAETNCAASSEFGVCPGTRKCLADGLSTCSASIPLPEKCDGGIDNNCDGATDDEGALGCVTYFIDYDGDGTGKSGSAGKCLCIASALYSATTATDCNDAESAINAGAKELCDDIDNDCDGFIDDGCDDDGDGWCDAKMVVVGSPAICTVGKKDCDDTAAGVHPSQADVCGNGIDDDCDGLTDSGSNVTGCVPFFQDGDGDGYGTGDSVCQCGATGLYTATTPDDCNDSAPSIHPGAAEVCGNGKDDNCNGTQDEVNAQGCNDYYVDLDQDGYGVATPICLCAASGDLKALSGGDCNDAASAVHPNAIETCDGIDNNCIGGVDEEDAQGCTTLFADQDGDGFGDSKKKGCVCAANLAYQVTDSTDCNDTAKSAHPGATEACDGIDNDCDGLTDEADADGCQVYFVDGDGDGYGATAEFACLCKATGQFKVSKLGDCADNNPAINPGALEVCDGIDNNCTGTTDENGAKGCSTFFFDGDLDGYGLDSASECLCAGAGFYTATAGGDCKDDDSAVHPKVTEVCDGLDNDCDGATDPANTSGCETWYVDKDGDNYGTALLASKCLCGGINGYAKNSMDCNDNDSAVNPGATEVCNGKDDNCDGSKDPKNTQGCTTYYADGDSDGYGVTSLNQCACTADTLFKAALSGDCNDGNANVNPGQAEACNSLDDNCNGQIDEGVLKPFYQDLDGDGWGGNVSNVQCGADAAYSSSTSGDCDDSKFAVNPGAAEICNYTDDNCNGQTDEGTGLTTWFKDLDGDTFGAGVGQLLCGATGLFTVTDNTDCDDSVYSVHPGAPDVCDGLDNNCNGATDENLPTTWYFSDVDKDGYGAGGDKLQCGKFGAYTATVPGDCDDTKSLVYPGAQEICDGVDNNCDGTTDEGFATTTYYLDADNDGYGTATTTKTACGTPFGYVANATDCNDANASVHPGAADVCGNSVDDNCNGSVDEGCCSINQTWNFDTGPQGFTHGTTVASAGDTWAQGQMGLGDTCHGNNNGCWSTGLADYYANCESAALKSPTIDLSGCATSPKTVTLGFWGRYDFESGYDGAVLQVSTNGGQTWADVTTSVAYNATLSTNNCAATATIHGHKSWTGSPTGLTWKYFSYTVPIAQKVSGFTFRWLVGTDSNTYDYFGMDVDDVTLVAQ